MNNKRKRIFLYGSITFFVFLICIWVFAGRISKHYLERWLKGHGAEIASIESLTLNPFTFSVKIQNVKIQPHRDSFMVLENAYMKISLWGLIYREFRISEAVFQGINLSVEKNEEQIEIGGFPLPLPESPPIPTDSSGFQLWKIKLRHASILNSHIRVQLPEMNSQIQIEKFLAWDALLSEKEKYGAFAFSGAVNGSEVKMDSTFGLDGKNGTASCKLDCKKVSLEGFQGLFPGSGSRMQGELSVNSMFAVELENNRIEISQKGKGTLNDFQFTISPYLAAGAAAEFQTDLLLTMKNNRFSSSRMVASLYSQDFQVTDTDTDFTIVAWENTRAEKVEISYKKSLMIFLPLLQTSMVTFATPPEGARGKTPLLIAEKLSIEDSRFGENVLEIGHVVLDKAEGMILLDPDNTPVNIPELQIVEEVTEEQAAIGSGKKGHDIQKEAWGIRMDLFEITGDSRFTFIDESVAPAFVESISIKKAEIAGLDSQKPDKESLFVLHADVKDYGKLKISGSMKPFAADLAMEINQTITEYPLPDLSAYSRALIGYDFKRGQLNTDTHLTISGNELLGETVLKVYGIHLTPSASDITKQITKQATMPFNVAVGYLTDNDGNLELEIPISGSLEDPRFGLSYFFQIILMKAARSAAYSAIKTAVLPYGALLHYGVDAAIYAGKELIKLRFDPVLLNAGEVLPGKAADEYTKQLSELMKQETELRIIICGFATDEDRRVLKDRTKDPREMDRLLLEIARERADTFKEILVSHYEVPSSRILECQPSIDPDPGSKPRIEIEL